MQNALLNLAIGASLIAGFPFTGCASHVDQSRVIQPTAKIPSFQNIEIHINDNPRYSARRDYNESIIEFRKILQKKIESAFPNARVVSRAASDPGVRVTLTVEDFRYVSATGRFLTGVMVGNARLQVKVELSDMQTNDKNGEAVLGTTSSAMEGILGGTTSRQLDAVSDSIVALLQRRAN